MLTSLGFDLFCSNASMTWNLCFIHANCTAVFLINNRISLWKQVFCDWCIKALKWSYPLMSLRVGFAPAWISASTMSREPLKLAIISGVILKRGSRQFTSIWEWTIWFLWCELGSWCWGRKRCFSVCFLSVKINFWTVLKSQRLQARISWLSLDLDIMIIAFLIILSSMFFLVSCSLSLNQLQLKMKQDWTIKIYCLLVVKFSCTVLLLFLIYFQFSITKQK